MCGIFGYVGKEEKSSVAICIEGLKSLEYRGYDSAGLAGIRGGEISTFKTKGRVEELERLLEMACPSIKNIIAHTRWATHGEPSTVNAHPHSSQNQDLAIVHNGIIENYGELKEGLLCKNVKFSSETDTEVIAHLISDYYQGDLKEAFRKALNKLEGSYAIALIHKNHPDQILASCKNAPLIVAWSDHYKEIYLCSDPSALKKENLKMSYLVYDSIVSLSPSGIEVIDLEGQEQKLAEELFLYEKNQAEKGIYEHYMLKEIYEQPSTIRKALEGRINEFIASCYFEELTLATQDLADVEKVALIGCGTSYHAALAAAMMLQEIALIPSEAHIASEFRYSSPLIDENTLVIAISQSGETADTLAAVFEAKQKGAKVLGICNVKHSLLARNSDSCLFLKAGPEISVCSTKAFTSQLSVLALLTIHLARIKELPKLSAERYLFEIKKLPSLVEATLSQAKQIEALAKKYSHYKNFFFIGRRSMFITALEAALKLKEISYVNACAYPAGELKHGPIALIDENLPTIALCGHKETFSKTLGNIAEIKARKGPVIAFAHEKSLELEALCQDVIYLPKVELMTASIPYSVALQLFAYFIAKEKGTDIDKPRNLAKSVTVE